MCIFVYAHMHEIYLMQMKPLYYLLTYTRNHVFHKATILMHSESTQFPVLEQGCHRNQRKLQEQSANFVYVCLYARYLSLSASVSVCQSECLSAIEV